VSSADIADKMRNFCSGLACISNKTGLTGCDKNILKARFSSLNVLLIIVVYSRPKIILNKFYIKFIILDYIYVRVGTCGVKYPQI